MAKMVNIPDDEITLIELCLRENANAQRALFEKYYGKMSTVCLRYLKNEDDTLEVINNAFLRVFEKIAQFKAEGSLEAWIRRIVINAAIDFIKKDKAYRNRFVRTDEFSLYGKPDEHHDEEEGTMGADAHFSERELLAFVMELPPATRVVFNLYAIDNFSHKSISTQLKISEGTSKWHLSNARKILSERIVRELETKKNKLNHGTEGFRNG